MTTIGKYRHLSRCTSRSGHFVVLAIDHRANLLQALNRYTAVPVTDAEFTAFKQEVIAALSGAVTAVLADPAYGIGAGIASGAIGGRMGVLSPVEVTNYDLSPDQRSIEFIPHWSVRKIKLAGGDGVKLLLPYHPDTPGASGKNDIVRRIVDECGEYDIPFFLEPIAYSPDPARDLSSDELREVTVDMARAFSSMGVDVLKLHFPLDTSASSDTLEWRDACEAVTAASSVPWVLLSAGVPYDVFVEQTRVACTAGASGVIVGRAVWNEAIALQGEARRQVIQNVLPERMRELAMICENEASSWFSRVAAPDSAPDWYEDYAEPPM